ncbi:MAG: DUF167 domain-containing protein [Candidatus Eiseniibacteriota bacterium]
MTAGLRLRVQPGARRTSLRGWMADGTLKLSVSEPPEDGRANRAVVGLLATVLGVREATVRVVRGHGARIKVVEVDDMDERTMRARISAGLEAGQQGLGEAARGRQGPREEGGGTDGG